MTSRLLIAVLMGALVGGALALTMIAAENAGPDNPNSASAGRALVGGPFRLVGSNGQQVTDKDFAGRYMLVYFGYTHCPDVCPSGLQVISAAIDKLGARAERLTPIFITLDPERDTPEVMASYVKSFHPRLLGLTGTRAEIDGVTKAYRVYAKKVDNPASPDDYSIDHSSFMYLMDGNGEFVRHFPHALDPDKLAADLGQTLK